MIKICYLKNNYNERLFILKGELLFRYQHEDLFNDLYAIFKLFKRNKTFNDSVWTNSNYLMKQIEQGKLIEVIELNDLDDIINIKETNPELFI